MIVSTAQAGLFGMPLPAGLLEGAGLFLARTSAMLLATPLIGSGASFYGYKVALVTSVTVALFASQGMPTVVPDSWVHFALLTFRELFLGLALAFILHMVVMAVRIGSEMVGNEMAFTMANSVDPASGESMPLLSRMNETLFFLAFLSVNGHHWVLRALGESYERAPIGEMEFGGNIIATITTLFGDLFSAGIAFAAPVLVLLIMVTVMLGLIARAVPQVNIMEMGFSMRVGGGLTAICILSPTLAPAMTALLERFMTALEAGLNAIGT